jgi:hypothetical protein
MVYDFWGGALDQKASVKQGDLAKLKMFYKIEASKNLAKRMGYGFTEKKLMDGRVIVDVHTEGKVASGAVIGR